MTLLKAFDNIDNYRQIILYLPQIFPENCTSGIICSISIIISGEGVFTTKAFAKGEFLLEYKGDLIKSLKQARRLEKEYADKDLGCFMFYFKYREKSMW